MSEEQGLTPYETREILFYKTENGEVRVEILLFQENLWLTQAKMAELFEVQKAAISKHLKNIFESGELSEGFSCFQNGNNCGGRETVSDQLLQSGRHYRCGVSCELQKGDLVPHLGEPGVKRVHHQRLCDG